MVAAPKVPAVDVVLSGAPLDFATALRPGARFGPRAVREASQFFQSYSSALGVDIFDELSAIDGGDVSELGADGSSALAALATRAQQISSSGAVAGFVGGDQSVTLGALRGLREAKHKAFALLHIDACSDTLFPEKSPEKGRIYHRGVIRELLEAGLVRPSAVLQVGVRGPHASAEDAAFGVARGVEILGIDEVRWDLHSAVRAVRKLVGQGSLYVSVDVSALDPSVAPGTSVPSPGGMSTWELQQLLRALVGADIVGFDVVEIAPSYDPAGITALVGVTILHEILAAIADTRRSGRPATTSRQGRGRRLSP
jgi:agmatinase